ncbi:hypothetical protein NE237_004340 [Protea cynaroides]|uniref:acylphosphatase n=1 Tax=Protea cynaroides TaxID=273540 RepID=A0A9Q0KJ95_9MAGN|nr:hypothetical protein NE237_004340 [Protea cynaroides]
MEISSCNSYIYHRGPLVPSQLVPSFSSRIHTHFSSIASSFLFFFFGSMSSINNNSAAAAAADTTEPQLPSPKPAKTVRVVIKGRVQGVFYRNWTVENASELGLKGWVRNRRDGSVEALFSGNPDSLQEMEQRCRRGPPDAMVTSLQVFPSDEHPGPGFERRATV